MRAADDSIQSVESSWQTAAERQQLASSRQQETIKRDMVNNFDIEAQLTHFFEQVGELVEQIDANYWDSKAAKMLLTRRKFLASAWIVGIIWLDALVSDKDSIGSSQNSSNPIEEHLGAFIGIWLALAGLNKSLVMRIGATLEKLIEENIINPIKWEDEKFTEISKWTTVVLLLKIFIWLSVLQFHGKVWNARMEENKRQNVEISFWEYWVTIPLLEELLFRWIIPRFLDTMWKVLWKVWFKVDPTSLKFQKMRWSSLGFAYAHNFTSSWFSAAHLPLTQLIWGVFYYYIKEKYGIEYSWVSHGMSNTMAYNLWNLLSK